ncbi:MAG: hypothetical protein MMC33_009920 [Icmadophila ericetorum]|nr:hypothetical protein [Icmadophila ericetorum]
MPTPKTEGHRMKRIKREESGLKDQGYLGDSLPTKMSLRDSTQRRATRLSSSPRVDKDAKPAVTETPVRRLPARSTRAVRPATRHSSMSETAISEPAVISSIRSLPPRKRQPPNHYRSNSSETNMKSISPSEQASSNSLSPVQINEIRPSPQQELLMKHQSNEAIKAYNAATALLAQMSDNKKYDSPYGNPPPPPPKADGLESHLSNGTSGLSGVNGQTSIEAIDALLALANGGSLTDDEDDKTIADPNEVMDIQPDPSAITQSDLDVTATMNHVKNQLLAQQNDGHPNGLQNYGYSSSRPDPYGPQWDQANMLQSLLSKTGTPVNTVMPAAQGHATSQFYAHLSSRARSGTPSGVMNPAHAALYGNPAQMNERMFARPDILGRSLNSLDQQSGLIPPKANGLGKYGFIKSANAEEQKKIRSYGFPPLPGSKAGLRR